MSTFGLVDAKLAFEPLNIERDGVHRHGVSQCHCFLMCSFEVDVYDGRPRTKMKIRTFPDT